LAGNHFLFFWQPGSKVALSCWGLNPGPKIPRLPRRPHDRDCWGWTRSVVVPYNIEGSYLPKGKVCDSKQVAVMYQKNYLSLYSVIIMK